MKFEIVILFIIMVILNIAASEMYRDQKNIFWHVLRYIGLILIPIVCLLCNIYQ